MNIVKAAAILAAGVIIAAGIVMYFSPYQACMRGMKDRSPNAPAAVICAKHLGRG